jgi:hypothetical protein
MFLLFFFRIPYMLILDCELIELWSGLRILKLILFLPVLTSATARS